ncbi:5-(carboxyamino)imidazole ribonucleotide mutase [Enterococcus italicus]|uniref:N5-carboxyaminoimidazole ribonucleotide mutase n=1 Tax=Enterococcus italicus (strain DSM 15952 / CCUG 50447 / LMG 22039 / TP 1.5) TaxID=888064 RepID=E6LFM8_ENTI1|nr:5-(carboxyamino)imidazole ribonucleotide mutase [Enterococcus italicus]EFU73990.1 phosphoribosylaminoimidazole carboxylase, catalytic subunit [Enterococcus italicus DSM 15952]MCM6880897.1 5-(carboxyamino)imidazole ribonucleotide mutase [Enterococcus italicus]OJG60840.1 phosphoribosylaminoimidazole carboxylase [Enterococcus italicus DSM 15952]
MKRVAIVMGSISDWETMKESCLILEKFNIPYTKQVVSAHRNPDKMFEFAKQARKDHAVIIAGAGGAAHLPGMIASQTTLPVIGVPIQTKALHGLDSLLSIVQMPGGIPVATTAIGKSGAINAALLATQILSIYDKGIEEKLASYREEIRIVSEESSDQLD